MPSWLDLKAVLTLCSLVVASGGLFWNWRRTQKRISYDYWSAPLMGSMKHSFSGRLELTFDGKVVRDVSQVNIRIKNNGYLPIEKKDIDTPLSISFKEPSAVLSVSLIKTVPESLTIDAAVDIEEGRHIALSPALLNPKDEFTITGG